MEQQSKKKHTGNGVRCYRIILGIALVVIIALTGWYMLSCSKNATPKEGTLVKSNCESRYEQCLLRAADKNHGCDVGTMQ